MYSNRSTALRVVPCENILPNRHLPTILTVLSDCQVIIATAESHQYVPGETLRSESPATEYRTKRRE